MRENRYTRAQPDKTGEFTISIPLDKPVPKEYPITPECRVLYMQRQDISLLPEDIRANMYPQDIDGSNPMANRDPHTAYIGQIVDAYIRKINRNLAA